MILQAKKDSEARVRRDAKFSRAESRVIKSQKLTDVRLCLCW